MVLKGTSDTEFILMIRSYNRKLNKLKSLEMVTKSAFDRFDLYKEEAF